MKIYEYRIPNIIRYLKINEYRIVQFGPNYWNNRIIELFVATLLCRCAGLLLLGVIKVHNLTIYSFPAVSGAACAAWSPVTHRDGDLSFGQTRGSIAHKCMMFLNICSLISQWQCQLPLKVLNGSFILTDWCKMRGVFTRWMLGNSWYNIKQRTAEIQM